MFCDTSYSPGKGYFRRLPRETTTRRQTRNHAMLHQTPERSSSGVLICTCSGQASLACLHRNHESEEHGWHGGDEVLSQCYRCISLFVVALICQATHRCSSTPRALMCRPAGLTLSHLKTEAKHQHTQAREHPTEHESKKNEIMSKTCQLGPNTSAEPQNETNSLNIHQGKLNLDQRGKSCSECLDFYLFLHENKIKYDLTRLWWETEVSHKYILTLNFQKLVFTNCTWRTIKCYMVLGNESAEKKTFFKRLWSRIWGQESCDWQPFSL